MSKENCTIEIELKCKCIGEKPEVTELQHDITEMLIQATPDNTKLIDALTAGCLYVANFVDQCLPDRPFFKEAFYSISTLVTGLINVQYKEKRGGEE